METNYKKPIIVTFIIKQELEKQISGLYIFFVFQF